MCNACEFDHALAMECQDRLPEYLGHLYLFRGLSEEQLESVLVRHRMTHLNDGRWLYREGDAADRFYVLREGQIALFRQSSDGRESIIAILGKDEVFGEELLFQKEAVHDLHARAIGDCTLLSLDRLAFRSLLGTSTELCHRVMTTLHRRQQMLLDHIEGLTLKDATQRLVAYLLDRAGHDEGPKRLQLTIPKSTLASHLSIQPETLSRILARLKDCHYLSEDGDALVILSPADMREGLGCTLCHLRYWGCPGPSHRALSDLELLGASTPSVVS